MATVTEPIVTKSAVTESPVVRSAVVRSAVVSSAVIESAAPHAVVRVVKGSLADEELAALTAVLLARAAVSATSVKGSGSKAAAHWQRPERRSDYRSPVSWHS
jgi:hypothetical protein